MQGEVIGDRFELESLLGRGGMSEVWRAHDRELDRPVAVKLCAPHADRARFEREARAVADLSHPNIARLYDFGDLGDRPYLVLEYLPGGTLAERLRGGEALPDDETEAIARDVAAALAHAHAKGTVHRDLKPSNVLFDAEGRAKLADFGIARAWGDTTLTDPGTVLGTAAYISPEQVGGERVSPAADVYSFGALLFQMLTGRPPFPAEGPIQAALRHREEQPPRVREVREDAPAALALVADRSLAKDPAARPRDGAALLAALGGAPAALAGDASAADTAVLSVAKPSRGRRRRWALVALAALAVAGVAVGILVGGDDGAGTPEPSQPSATTGRTAQQETTEPSEPTTQEQTQPTEPAETTTQQTTTEATTSEATTTTEATTTEATTTEPTTTSETTTPDGTTTTSVGTTTASSGTTTDLGGR